MVRPAITRRRVLLAGLAGSVTGCASEPTGRLPTASGPAPFAAPWRSVNGGFLAPPTPGFGLPARPVTGLFVKLMAPGAIALRGNDLLVADLGVGRLWRVDIGLQTISGVAGAPATPLTALAIGPDLSAWVLDAPARQVLRFARDGRLLQTFRAGAAATSPVAIALAAGRASVFVLDRAAGLVHQVARDGRVLASLGAGELKQPVALAADRFDRVFVFDAQDASIRVLRAGEATVVLSAAQLGVQQIGGIAVDERVLAVADRLLGEVRLFTLRDGAAR